MAVSFVTSVSNHTGVSSSTSLSATIPASGPEVADVAICAITNERGTPATLPTGWTSLRGEADGSNLSTRVCWKRLTSGDIGAPVNTDWPATRRASMGISIFRGAGDPVVSNQAFATAGSSTDAVTGNNITPSANNAMLVSIAALGVFDGDLTRTMTPGSGWTEDADVSTQSTTNTNALTHMSHKLLSGGSGVSQTGETKVCSAPHFFHFMSTIYMVPGGPSGEAGPDQVNKEPWSTVALTGTGAGTWSQTGGTTVTLGGSGNNRTFEAPPSLAGEILTFEFGGTEMTVSVLGATERAVVGGVEVPLLTQKVLS